ncbi:aminoglycoside phosphotransferase family protein [Cellulomonas sp. PhB143]|uniref:aminoglycoside phosphotransferase family protein n=1 Tax=Cellulomonas sp. PhB143 TaxID=2485186 RepID=UPI000F47E599|nr:aminoglycoside phosphotransferase family protein [Cellulomonas sp. PhB143]
MADAPAAEVDVTVGLVRSLLRAQHPDLAALPLSLVANGWDNAVLRLGEDLAVRAPRRAAAARLVRHEQEWLPRIAPTLPVAVPVPVRAGRPTTSYPWAWSVVPWFEGVDAIDVPRAGRGPAAPALAAFVGALHRPAPRDAPHNPVRGVPLLARDAVVRERIASGLVPDAARTASLWSRLVAVPPWAGPPVWLHGDLHPGNLLLAPPGAPPRPDGPLRAVVDFGDLTAGDPATDLATAWLTFDDDARATFRAAVTVACGTDDDTWARARGWALCLGTALVAHSDDSPRYAELGASTLRAVLASA